MMLIAVPANAVRFSQCWQPPARAHPHNGTCRTCENVSVVLVWSAATARMPTAALPVVPSPQPAYGWRCPASAAGHCGRFSHSIRRARCGMSRVTVAQRLAMGKEFCSYKTSLHWVCSAIVNGINAACSQRCRALHQTDPAQCHCAPVPSVVQLPECGGLLHGQYRARQYACLFFASVSFLTVEDPHNATVFCRNRCGDLRVHVRLRSAMAFSPSVAGTTPVTSACEAVLKQLRD